jgi:uncharacterized protein YjbJ (UPF0337 family)
MFEKPKSQEKGPFQKMKSSFREIFGKTYDDPPLATEGAGDEQTDKDRKNIS